MNTFLITGRRTPTLALAVEVLNGKSILENSWIATWSGTADALCQFLRRTCSDSVLVCPLDNADWRLLR